MVIPLTKWMIWAMLMMDFWEEKGQTVQPAGVALPTAPRRELRSQAVHVSQIFLSVMFVKLWAWGCSQSINIFLPVSVVGITRQTHILKNIRLNIYYVTIVDFIPLFWFDMYCVWDTMINSLYNNETICQYKTLYYGNL
jgi:hypothetical protein